MQKVNKDKFRETLNRLKPGLGDGKFLEVLNHFCFSDEHGIVVFNSKQTIIMESDIKGINCAVQGDRLVGLLSSYSEKEVSIGKEGSEFIISTVGSESKINIKDLKATTYSYPSTDKGLSFKLNEDFITGVKKCLVSSGEGSAAGVRLNASNDKTILYSTDDVCISRYTLKSTISSDDFTVLLPKSFCELLLDLSKFMTPEKAVVQADKIVAIFDKGLLSSEFDQNVKKIDFEGMFSSGYEKKLKFLPVPENFSSVLDRSLVLTSGELEQFVNITVGDDFLDLLTHNDFGSVNDDIDCLGQKGSLKFTINAKALRRALTIITEMVFMDYDGRGAMFVGKDGQFLHLVSSKDFVSEEDM